MAKIKIELTKIEAKRLQEALYWYQANGNAMHLFSRKSGTVRTCVGIIDKVNKAADPKKLGNCEECSACKFNKTALATLPCEKKVRGDK